jgi:hypothetical protein
MTSTMPVVDAYPQSINLDRAKLAAACSRRAPRRARPAVTNARVTPACTNTAAFAPTRAACEQACRDLLTTIS